MIGTSCSFNESGKGFVLGTSDGNIVITEIQADGSEDSHIILRSTGSPITVSLFLHSNMFLIGTADMTAIYSRSDTSSKDWHEPFPGIPLGISSAVKISDYTVALGLANVGTVVLFDFIQFKTLKAIKTGLKTISSLAFYSDRIYCAGEGSGSIMVISAFQGLILERLLVLPSSSSIQSISVDKGGKWIAALHGDQKTMSSRVATMCLKAGIASVVRSEHARYLSCLTFANPWNGSCFVVAGGTGKGLMGIDLSGRSRIVNDEVEGVVSIANGPGLVIVAGVCHHKVLDDVHFNTVSHRLDDDQRDAKEDVGVEVDAY